MFQAKTDTAMLTRGHRLDLVRIECMDVAEHVASPSSSGFDDHAHRPSLRNAMSDRIHLLHERERVSLPGLSLAG